MEVADKSVPENKTETYIEVRVDSFFKHAHTQTHTYMGFFRQRNLF